MANFSSIETELNVIINEKLKKLIETNKKNPDQNNIAIIVQQSCFEIRMKYLSDLAKYTNRNTIVYFSTYWQGNPSNAFGLQINDNDIVGFMNSLSKMDKSKGLDLIIQTPGGLTTATESIILYLRKMFNEDIRVIVPHLAMSGGTMIACSGKEIMMGKHSYLGPIDPQVRGIPAEGLISEFNDVMKEVLENNQKILVYQQIVSKIMPTMLNEAKNAIEMSKQIAKHALTTGMFLKDDNREVLSDNVINGLSHEASKQHDKHFDIDYCRKIGLRVLQLESDPNLQDKVLSSFHTYIVSAYKCPDVLKFIEANNEQTYITRGERK